MTHGEYDKNDLKMFRIKKSNNILVVYKDYRHPRIFFENFGSIIGWYQDFSLVEENSSPELARKKMEYIKSGGGVFFPIYLLNNKVKHISTEKINNFHIGYIYVEGYKIKKKFCIHRITDEIYQKVKEILLNEIKILDQYLQENLYAYDVLSPWGEIVDSSWGFFGYNIENNGILTRLNVSKHSIEKINGYFFKGSLQKVS